MDAHPPRRGTPGSRRLPLLLRLALPHPCPSPFRLLRPAPDLHAPTPVCCSQELRIRPEGQYKTSFRVLGGQYEFRVGAFGLHQVWQGRWGADQRPAPRALGRNQRPAPSAPEPRPCGLARASRSLVDPPDLFCPGLIRGLVWHARESRASMDVDNNQYRKFTYH